MKSKMGEKDNKINNYMMINENIEKQVKNIIYTSRRKHIFKRKK